MGCASTAGQFVTEHAGPRVVNSWGPCGSTSPTGSGLLRYCRVCWRSPDTVRRGYWRVESGGIGRRDPANAVGGGEDEGGATAAPSGADASPGLHLLIVDDH